MGTHLVWNVPPIFLLIGPFQIRFYALFFVAGILLSQWVGTKMFKQEGLDPESLKKLIFYCILGTIIGARLGHCLIYQPEIYLRDPLRILKVWEGGLASHGGSLGVMVSSLFWKRKYFKGSVLQMTDLLCVGLALIATFIRIGNLFNSEIIGRPTDVPWAVVFPQVDTFARHPTMIYESISYGAVFLILYALFKRGMTRTPGLIAGLFFVGVFGARFVIEFYKEAQVQAEINLPLNYGQLLSVPFILAGIILLLRVYKIKKVSSI